MNDPDAMNMTVDAFQRESDAFWTKVQALLAEMGGRASIRTGGICAVATSQSDVRIQGDWRTSADRFLTNQQSGNA